MCTALPLNALCQCMKPQYLNSLHAGYFFSNINFFKTFKKNHCFHPFILLIYNLNVKRFGSQMMPHILWGFIWIQIVCKGHQRSSKFTASGLWVKGLSEVLHWKRAPLWCLTSIRESRATRVFSFRVVSLSSSSFRSSSIWVPCKHRNSLKQVGTQWSKQHWIV